MQNEQEFGYESPKGRRRRKSFINALEQKRNARQDELVVGNLYFYPNWPPSGYWVRLLSKNQKGKWGPSITVKVVKVLDADGQRCCSKVGDEFETSASNVLDKRPTNHLNMEAHPQQCRP